VSQSQPLNPADPFSTPFIVADDGPLGINAIKFTCLLIDVETVHQNRFIDVGLLSEALSVDGMDPGEKATVPCVFRSFFGLSPSDPIAKGNVAMVVEFRPDFVPWRIRRKSRFMTLRASDGNLYWYPQPYSRLPATQH